MKKNHEIRIRISQDLKNSIKEICEVLDIEESSLIRAIITPKINEILGDLRNKKPITYTVIKYLGEDTLICSEKLDISSLIAEKTTK